MSAATTTPASGPIARSEAATVTLLKPAARLSLRARPGDLSRIGAALGLDLPKEIGRRSAAGGTDALCLGPDEWLIQAPESETGSIAQACADIYAEAPHSLTEITDREVTLRIEGPKAAELLTLGCPRDIGRIPVGEARRTIFDGATVVLWRDTEQSFRMDIWRSFAPHVTSLLKTATTEIAAES